MFEVAGPVATDAGMQVLWNPERFASVVDYDSWEDLLLEDEDILQHVTTRVAGLRPPIEPTHMAGTGLPPKLADASSTAGSFGLKPRVGLQDERCNS